MKIDFALQQEAAQAQKLQKRVAQTVAILQNGGWVGHSANAVYTEMDDEVLRALTRLLEALSTAAKSTQEYWPLDASGGTRRLHQV